MHALFALALLEASSQMSIIKKYVLYNNASTRVPLVSNSDSNSWQNNICIHLDLEFIWTYIVWNFVNCRSAQN